MRDWIKPELIIEEFELSQHVAATCAVKYPRTKSIGFVLYNIKGETSSGTASDSNYDSNDYVDADEVIEAVQNANHWHGNGNKPDYYTITGSERHFIYNSSPYPFSS